MTFFSANGEYTCDKINEHFGTSVSNYTKSITISTDKLGELSNSQTLIGLDNVCELNEKLCTRIERSTFDVPRNNEYTTTDKYKKIAFNINIPQKINFNPNNKSSIVKCKFDITTTDQGFGNHDGTQIRLFLTNDGKEYDIIPKNFCINQNYLKFGLPRENNFKGQILFEQPLNIRKETIIYLELYNLYPAHQAHVKEMKLLNLHIWDTD